MLFGALHEHSRALHVQGGVQHVSRGLDAAAVGEWFAGPRDATLGARSDGLDMSEDRCEAVLQLLTCSTSLVKCTALDLRVTPSGLHTDHVDSAAHVSRSLLLVTTARAVVHVLSVFQSSAKVSAAAVGLL